MFIVDNKDIRMMSFYCLFAYLKHISHLFLVCLMLTMDMYLFARLFMQIRLCEAIVKVQVPFNTFKGLYL